MSDSDRPFAGKVAWVTGAGSGIGEATAMMFAQGGATLVLNDRRADRIQASVDRLASFGVTAHICAGDLRDVETSRRTGALIAKEAGRLDFLVNCAGHNVPDRQWANLSTDSIDSILGTNLAAPFYCVAVALPLMRERHSGLLVHIASTDGLRVGTVGGPAYCASKHGLVAMSHTINLEEAVNGIRSCVVCPGGVDTEFLEHRATPPSGERRAKLLRPADVADVIRYVASVRPTVRIDQVTVTPAI